MKRLRVLLVPAWYPSSEDPVAGIFVRDQARALATRHDVTVLAPHSATGTGAVEEGVRVLGLPATRGLGRLDKGLHQLRILSAAVARLRKEGWVPDLVHAHVFSAGFFAVIVGRRWRVPVVISEHHSDVIEGRLVGLNGRIARFAYRQADMVCPVSSLLERSLLRFEPRARCEVVGNVVDVDVFGRWTRHKREPPGSRLLAVATLHRNKGLRDLLEAVTLLTQDRPDVTLEIVGDGPDRAALEKLAEGLPVTFVGALTRVDVAARMRDADVLAMPSLVETFGIAAVEALAAGLPVVCTSACGVADVVAGHGGLVVPASDPTALSDALAALLDRGEGVPTATLDEVRRRFGSVAIADRLDSVYSSLLQARAHER